MIVLYILLYILIAYGLYKGFLSLEPFADEGVVAFFCSIFPLSGVVLLIFCCIALPILLLAEGPKFIFKQLDKGFDAICKYKIEINRK